MYLTATLSAPYTLSCYTTIITLPGYADDLTLVHTLVSQAKYITLDVRLQCGVITLPQVYCEEELIILIIAILWTVCGS